MKNFSSCTSCFLHQRCFKRHSRAALNRQQELSHLPMPPQLRLYEYLQRRKERKTAPTVDLKISKIGNVSSHHTHDLVKYVNKLKIIEFVYYLLHHDENCLSSHPPTCLSITTLISLALNLRKCVASCMLLLTTIS